MKCLINLNNFLIQGAGGGGWDRQSKQEAKLGKDLVPIMPEWLVRAEKTRLFRGHVP